ALDHRRPGAAPQRGQARRRRGRGDPDRTPGRDARGRRGAGAARLPGRARPARSTPPRSGGTALFRRAGVLRGRRAAGLLRTHRQARVGARARVPACNAVGAAAGLSMDAAELERWRRADLEFERLLALPGPQRAARLRALAGADPVMHDRVLRLLRAHDTDGGVLDRPGAAPLAMAPGALAGRRLGRW